MSNLEELLNGKTDEELELLRDHESIADSFLTSNFQYRDGSSVALIDDIKAQTLVLARLRMKNCDFVAWLKDMFPDPILKLQNKCQDSSETLNDYEMQLGNVNRVCDLFCSNMLRLYRCIRLTVVLHFYLLHSLTLNAIRISLSKGFWTGCRSRYKRHKKTATDFPSRKGRRETLTENSQHASKRARSSTTAALCTKLRPPDHDRVAPMASIPACTHAEWCAGPHHPSHLRLGAGRARDNAAPGVLAGLSAPGWRGRAPGLE